MTLPLFKATVIIFFNYFLYITESMITNNIVNFLNCVCLKRLYWSPIIYFIAYLHWKYINHIFRYCIFLLRQWAFQIYLSFMWKRGFRHSWCFKVFQILYKVLQASLCSKWKTVVGRARAALHFVPTLEVITYH